MFFYCILICLLKYHLKARNSLSCIVLGINKNNSKQQSWPPKGCCLKDGMDQAEEMGRRGGTEGKEEQVTTNEINARTLKTNNRCEIIPIKDRIYSITNIVILVSCYLQEDKRGRVRISVFICIIVILYAWQCCWFLPNAVETKNFQLLQSQIKVSPGSLIFQDVLRIYMI